MFIIPALTAIIGGLMVTQVAASPSYIAANYDYTYYPVAGTFGSSNTLSDDGYYVYVATDWGSATLAPSGYVFSEIKYGSTVIGATGGWWDTKVGYRWENLSTVADGRIFASYWSTWKQVLNDTEIGVWERYAEAPHLYSGSTAEWNITLRICVFKHDPYIRSDAWIQNLNDSSLVLDFWWQNFYRYGDTGCDSPVAYSRQLVYCDKISGAYSVGVVSPYSGTGNNGVFGNYYYRYDYDRLKDDKDKYYAHAQNWLVFGQTHTDVISSALKIGKVCNVHEDTPLAYNVMYAKNTQRYDAFDYVVGGSYTYYASETSETVYANGVSSTATFTASPLGNYRRIPLAHTYDAGCWLVNPTAANVTWLYMVNEAVQHSVPWTVCVPSSEFDYNETHAQESIDYMVNLTLSNYGVLFEYADHSRNHDDGVNFWANRNHSYAYDRTMLSQTTWLNESDESIRSEQFTFNAYGGATLEDIAAAGIKTARLNVHSTAKMHPLSVTNDTTEDVIWAFPWHWGTYMGDGMPDSGSETTMEIRTAAFSGYWMAQIHEDDWYGDENKVRGAAWLSWVENNTDDYIPVTLSQLNDLWTHQITYYTDLGAGILDMSTCLMNHTVYWDLDHGYAPVFTDQATDAFARPFTVSDEGGRYFMDDGVTYEALPFGITSASAAVTLNMTTWTPTSSVTAAAWTIDASVATAAVSFTVSGLRSDLGYRVLQDDDVIATGFGESFTFSAIGGGDFEIVAWYPASVSRLVVLAVDMVGIGIIVTIVMGFVMPTANAIRNHKRIETKKLMNDLMKLIVIIVVGVALWRVLHEVAIG